MSAADVEVAEVAIRISHPQEKGGRENGNIHAHAPISKKACYDIRMGLVLHLR